MTDQQSLQERLRQEHAGTGLTCCGCLEAADALAERDALIAMARTALQRIHDEWELGGACCAATAADALAKLKAAGHTSAA